jgi:uncharacterized membrane protein YfcA
LVNDQRDAQFFTMYLFLTLYMFRAPRAHHQERQIVSTQPLVTVTLFTVGGRGGGGGGVGGRGAAPHAPPPQTKGQRRQGLL